MIKFLLYILLKISNFIRNCWRNYIRYNYNLIFNKLKLLHIESIVNTIDELINSNKSLSRFGDGELRWALDARNVPDFQVNSPILRKRLLIVLSSNIDNLMIGLPNAFHSNKYDTSKSKYFWEKFCVKYGNKVLPLLSNVKQYYNTSVSRPYMDYNIRSIANIVFNKWKILWKNRNILIVEGSESHVGENNDLFKSAKSIKRIECPARNAFESYNKILSSVVDFISNNTNYLILLALGPTATVMSYDLCRKGFRAIDIGHIDVEYEWYLIGAKEKIDLPHRYVDEVPGGNYALPTDSKFKSEIIKHID